jgi:hypothetical protein
LLEYVLIDLSQYTDEEIKSAFRQRVAAIVMPEFSKHVRDRDLMGFFEGPLPFFDELERTDTALRYIEAGLNYIGYVIGEQDLDDAAEPLRRVAPKTTEVARSGRGQPGLAAL